MCLSSIQRIRAAREPPETMRKMMLRTRFTAPMKVVVTKKSENDPFSFTPEPSIGHVCQHDASFSYKNNCRPASPCPFPLPTVSASYNHRHFASFQRLDLSFTFILFCIVTPGADSQSFSFVKRILATYITPQNTHCEKVRSSACLVSSFNLLFKTCPSLFYPQAMHIRPC